VTPADLNDKDVRSGSVAIFRLQINSISRGAGRRATAAAAYRAGERIRDERSGDLHNYSSRKDVLHKEIFLPSHLTGQNVHWARDRSALWNAAEQAESRRTARVAREFQVTLPAELSPEQRLRLARGFSQEVANRYKIAVDLAVHEPRAGGDPRNYHAHLLATTREATAAGLGAKAGLDLSAKEFGKLGLSTNGSQEYTAIRERWATLTNQALREAHIDARVDHRSLEAQGVAREPKPAIPLAALKMEQSGLRSEVAERLREEYSARVQARQNPVVAPKSLEDIRREAREAWLKMRQGGTAADRQSDKQPTREPVHQQPGESTQAAEGPPPRARTADDHSL
jgi:ATP-dependent exoDNAse (exonuclease V) alpha subunit